MSIINRKFGPYVLLKKLAVGGMAELFLAIKIGPGPYEKLVVLKTILAHHNDNPEYVELFYHEAAIGGMLNHPNVIHTYDTDVIDGTHVMVMEFMQGVTIAEMAERGAEVSQPLPQEFAIQLIIDACEGLHYAHTADNAAGNPYGIVHRDISPQNIFVTYEGQAKVFDFGIALTNREEGEEDPHKGMFAGKYAYMSPEQARAEEVDARSDVFSLGIILYELTTGSRLFKRENQIAAINAITKDPITPPSEVLDRYPRFLERIVLKALAKERDERYDDAHSLAEDLRKFLKISGAKPTAHKVGEFVRRLFNAEIKGLEAELLTARQLVEQSHGRPDPMEAAARSAMQAQIAAAKAARAQADTAAPPPRKSAPAPKLPEASPEVHTPERPTGPQRLAKVAITEHEPAPKDSNKLVPILLAVIVLLIVGGVFAFMKFGGGDEGQSGSRTLQDESTVNNGKLKITSSPIGADIYINGAKREKNTPATLEVPFDEEISVEVRYEGYETFKDVVVVDKDIGQRFVEAILKEATEGDEGEAQKGSVKITTQPEGVTVFFDGEEQSTTTPLTIEGIEVGTEHALILRHPGHASKLVPLTLDSPGTLELPQTLQALPEDAVATINIDSWPKSARVEIDGAFAGLTPLPSLDLEAKTVHTLTVRSGSLPTYEEEFELKPGEERMLKARLVGDGDAVEDLGGEPPAIVRIVSEPPTSVLYKGQALGLTPIDKVELDPGTTVLEFVDLALGVKHVEVISLNSGVEREISVVIPKGKLDISSTPEGARVFLNNIEIGVTPITEHELYVGEPLVRIEAEGYSTFEDNVTIQAGRDTSLNPTLEPIETP